RITLSGCLGFRVRMATSGGAASGYASMFTLTNAGTPPIMKKKKSATMSARSRTEKAMIVFMARLSNKLDCSAHSFGNMGRQPCIDERKTGDNADTENSGGKDLFRQSRPTKPRKSRYLCVRAHRNQGHLRQR